MKLLVGVDASGASAHLAEAAAAAARAGPGSEVHLVSVLPPPVVAVPPSPVATAASLTAVLAAQEQQAKVDEQRAREALQEAAAECIKAGIPRSHVHAHLLPAAGGASGVGESIAEFAKARGVDLVALGSRGMGSIKRSLMSLVGLGSVSDWCAHQLAVPVLVARPAGHEGGKPAAEAAAGEAAAGEAAAGGAEGAKPRVVVVAVDDSAHSSHALDWVVASVLGPSDELHCVCVALPVPYPILDETSAAVAALEAQEWQASSERSYAYARELASRAAARAGAGAWAGAEGAARVVAAALVPEGGASDVGAAIVKYAREHEAGLVVVGSRGMGSLKRSIMGFVGLGSVSDYCLHHLACPVVVVKGQEGDLPDVAAHAEGAAAAAAAATATGAAAAAPAGGAAVAERLA